MNGWWVYDYWQNNPLGLFCVLFWVIFSICLHELGHGFVAIRCGDDTPRATGHMTWNPLVHIPPMAWILFAISGFTWGLMPVNPSRFRRTIDDAWVSFAGPAVNLILAVLCILLAAAWLNVGAHVVGKETLLSVSMFLRIGASLNIFLFVFNLLPIPPLDGSSILGTFIPEFRRMCRSPGAMTAGLVIIVLLSRMGATAWLSELSIQVSQNSISTLLGLFRSVTH